MHAAQHLIVRVLHGQVDVFHELRLARDRLDELVTEIRRIAVERADPVHALDRAERAQELRELRLAVEVAPVLRRVLRDEDDLLHAARGEVHHLIADILDGAAAVGAADVGDGAEGAAVVAALGDLHIGGVGGRRRDARRVLVIEQLVLACDDDAVSLERLLDGLHDAVPRACADDGIRLRHIIEELLPVALAEATCDDEAAAAAGLLVFRHVEDGRDRLLLGGLDERACIDDEDIRLRRLRRELDAVLPEDAEHHFRIDEILGTAKTDKTCFHNLSSIFLRAQACRVSAT